MGKITAPAPIAASHLIAAFDCGVTSLNEWLRRQALKNEIAGASRTFVVCDGATVIGYYALAVGSVIRQGAPGRVRRGMPEPIPVVVLARLAVAPEWQGKGLGVGLLRDAILRTVAVSRQAGIRALLVHALSDEAKKFYLRYGFQESPANPYTLMRGLQDIQAAL